MSIDEEGASVALAIETFEEEVLELIDPWAEGDIQTADGKVAIKWGDILAFVGEQLKSEVISGLESMEAEEVVRLFLGAKNGS